MARVKKSRTESAAIIPPQGQKLTFGEENDSAQAGPSTYLTGKSVARRREDDDEDLNESDDEAPEAVPNDAVRMKEINSRKEARIVEEAKKKALAARSKVIQQVKKAKTDSKQTKDTGKGKDLKRKLENEDSAERARKRMEAAMEQASDESDLESGDSASDVDLDEDEDDLEGSDGDEEDDDQESFHTDSEDASSDGLLYGEEDDGENASDDSETLKEGPISDKDKSMRAKMQAMMEAMEARSGVSAGPASTTKIKDLKGKGKSILKDTADKATGSQRKDIDAGEKKEEEEEAYDLAPVYGRPLSKAALQAAEEMNQKRKLEKEKANRLERSNEKHEKRMTKKRKRKAVKREQKERALSDNKRIKLLEPSLSTNINGLPPIFDAKAQTSPKIGGTKSQTKFMRLAMKDSGVGLKGLMGRRRVGKTGLAA